MAEPPKLSQDELVKVLQKAAERENRDGPRSFTTDEAVQAGRELGISAGNVQAELDALAARQVARRPPRDLTRPFDTRVTVDRGPDHFRLSVPPRGLHLGALARLGFSALWLTFTSFWTKSVLTMDAPPVMLAFAIPFILVGLGMAGAAVQSMVGSQQLELDRQQGSLATRPLGRTHRLRTAELAVRLDQRRQRRSQGRQTIEVPVLALDHGTRTHDLLAHFSQPEQRWVKAELEDWLARD